MFSTRHVLFVIAIATLSLVACADQIPTAEPLELPAEAQEVPSSVEPDVAGSRDPDRPVTRDFYSYKHVRIFANLMLETLEQEKTWCDEQPEVTELRDMLSDHEAEDVWRSLLIPAGEQDLSAVRIIAEATADARGIPMQELPPVFLISRTSLRHYACLTDEVWEDESDEDEDSTIGRPASRLALLIGQDVEDYGEKEQNWLSATLYWGWYGEIEDADELEAGEDGVGQVVIVSAAPMPASFVGTISHELVHFLQDQWTDWRLHDWYRDSQTTDELEALRWVVEGDATLNELYTDVSPLLELLAGIEWGPDEHSEYDLWYRAYEALAPEDSASLYAAYEQGSDALAALRAEHGQSAIDQLLLDPPESSEQLIHAEKLDSDEQPYNLRDLTRLRAEIFTAGEWDEPIVDRMGEQWLRSLISVASKRPDIARKASTGWGSDQMALWQSEDGETVVVTWQVVFDNAEEHRQGVSGLRRWFYSHTANEAEPVYANMLSWDGPTGAARLITRPNAVWLVASNDPEIADEVAADIRSTTWTHYWSRP